MWRTRVSIVVLAFLALSSTAFALYSVFDTGNWPKEWPSELESLRKQSRTLVGPMVEAQHFAITFKTREEFEAAWPHILKAKSQGAPIFLKRGPNFFLDKELAGVVVHCPPKGQWDNPKTPEAPIKGYPTESPHRWQWTNYIELVVDGQIIDLNRIPIPADTPIIDGRFKADKTNEDAKSP
ncbi:hypothetical protein KOR42_48400 [Thalassoglobus neptunius]|uniref:Uncharacterized protein n=1 Tax=Thalassoglobus neptunius TaxID=1938619 RepID=A0A5C5VSR2_9PLAN|nr:hypothetical protein [Thalassoglobus neptunius]TWT41300.1 hypothetical protein KOR42_48400 [Thalassoglobus neptunius]